MGYFSGHLRLTLRPTPCHGDFIPRHAFGPLARAISPLAMPGNFRRVRPRCPAYLKMYFTTLRPSVTSGTAGGREAPHAGAASCRTSAFVARCNAGSLVFPTPIRIYVGHAEVVRQLLGKRHRPAVLRTALVMREGHSPVRDPAGFAWRNPREKLAAPPANNLAEAGRLARCEEASLPRVRKPSTPWRSRACGTIGRNQRTGCCWCRRRSPAPCATCCGTAAPSTRACDRAREPRGAEGKKKSRRWIQLVRPPIIGSL